MSDAWTAFTKNFVSIAPPLNMQGNGILPTEPFAKPEVLQMAH
jgi:hypothetical protein